MHSFEGARGPHLHQPLRRRSAGFQIRFRHMAMGTLPLALDQFVFRTVSRLGTRFESVGFDNSGAPSRDPIVDQLLLRLSQSVKRKLEVHHPVLPWCSRHQQCLPFLLNSLQNRLDPLAQFPSPASLAIGFARLSCVGHIKRPNDSIACTITYLARGLCAPRYRFASEIGRAHV